MYIYTSQLHFELSPVDYYISNSRRPGLQWDINIIIVVCTATSPGVRVSSAIPFGMKTLLRLICGIIT